MNLLFDDLPGAVSKILTKLNEIETLLYQQKQVAGSELDEWFDIDGLRNYLPGKPAKATIYANISTIPHKKFGKRLAFLKSEIDEWLMTKSQKTIADIEQEAEAAINKKGGTQ